MCWYCSRIKCLWVNNTEVKYWSWMQYWNWNWICWSWKGIWNNVGFRGARFTCDITELAKVGDIRLCWKRHVHSYYRLVWTELLCNLHKWARKIPESICSSYQPEKLAFQFLQRTFFQGFCHTSISVNYFPTIVVKRLIVTIITIVIR